MAVDPHRLFMSVEEYLVEALYENVTFPLGEEHER